MLGLIPASTNILQIAKIADEDEGGKHPVGSRCPPPPPNDQTGRHLAVIQRIVVVSGHDRRYEMMTRWLRSVAKKVVCQCGITADTGKAVATDTSMGWSMEG